MSICTSLCLCVERESECVASMCVSLSVCVCVFQVPEQFLSKRPDVRGGRGYKISDKPGQTGEGGSKNLDFGRTSFMDVPLVICITI